jgi:16S rRNA (adenine1518-N6/adenine1519-N6)-dimethyltransferase
VKRRGQNFLVDGNLARSIAVEVADLGRTVLELGAGGGALTVHLLDLCERVTAIEVDRKLCGVLTAEYGDREGFVLQEDDLARLDWAEVLASLGPRPVVAGNLPYVLTSKVLFGLADEQARVAGAVLMVQKEVAERLVATPGGRDYGVLAVVLGSLFDISMVRTVPATVFWPQPDVASAVVRLVPREPWPEAEYRWFVATVKTLFQQRRKQIGSHLRRAYGLDEAAVAGLADAVGFAVSDRPEQIAADAWRRLARALDREAGA